MSRGKAEVVRMTTEIPTDYMSGEAVADFLSDSRHAIVSTIRKNGSPHLSAVWYLYEDNCIYFVVLADSAKCRNIRRDPRVGICVDGGHADYRSVLIYGDAEILPGGHEFFSDKKRRIFRRYFDSDDDARAYVEETDAVGEGALIVVRPNRIVGVDVGK
jgi:PPOX class probable F420-dependent enzyme